MSKNSIVTYIVDSFTDEPFKGNPAGVCLLERELKDNKMLLIAQELGLSETVFVDVMDETGKCKIRFFSPKMEIPLCGHATLAAAKVLFERDTDLHEIHFVNIQAIDLIVKRDGDMIIMEFPIYPVQPAEVPPALLEALGLEDILNSTYNKETHILLLEIADSQIIRDLSPDFAALVASHDNINGVLVTALSKDEKYDFESRYFWPWSGTNEDPATGGTHTFLTKYWSDRLRKKKLRSFQCSARTGFMEVEILNEARFTIRSTAQIVLEGKLRL